MQSVNQGRSDNGQTSWFAYKSQSQFTSGWFDTEGAGPEVIAELGGIDHELVCAEVGKGGIGRHRNRPEIGIGLAETRRQPGSTPIQCDQSQRDRVGRHRLEVNALTVRQA